MNNQEYNNQRNELLEAFDAAKEAGDRAFALALDVLIRQLDEDYLQGNDNEIR